MLRWRAGTAAAAAVGVLLGGTACQQDQPTVELTVVTPPPSATAGGPASPPARSATPAPAPSSTGAAPSPADALTAYDALVADWQRSRSAFFTAVSDGTSRTVAQQRALAAAHLAALRRLAGGVRAAAPSWPAPARTAAGDLLAANSRQQATVAAMARAAGAGAFTAGLADYGVGVAAEERTIRAVRQALGG